MDKQTVQMWQVPGGATIDYRGNTLKVLRQAPSTEEGYNVVTVAVGQGSTMQMGVRTDAPVDMHPVT